MNMKRYGRPLRTVKLYQKSVRFIVLRDLEFLRLARLPVETAVEATSSVAIAAAAVPSRMIPS